MADMQRGYGCILPLQRVSGIASWNQIRDAIWRENDQMREKEEGNQA